MAIYRRGKNLVRNTKTFPTTNQPYHAFDIPSAKTPTPCDQRNSTALGTVLRAIGGRKLNSHTVSVRVVGDYACFTRPESKTERASYPVATPSAARGILEAIYWHPQFTWAIREIHVLAPVQTFSLVRNEVNSRMSLSRSDPYFADEDRTQRHAICLKQVDYVIHAEPVVKPGQPDKPQKFREIFARRVERGQCFHRPALGTREFAAEFLPAENAPPPQPWSEDLGLMLWDLDYSTGKPPYWPRFFHASIKSGVLVVPPEPIGAAR